MRPKSLIIIAALALVASAALWIALIFLADALGGLVVPVPLLVLLVGGVFGLAIAIVIRYLFTHDV